MKNYIEKNINIIIGIFLLMAPILDLMTGIGLNIFHMKITLGIICRFLFLIFIIYCVLIVFKKKKAWLFYSIIGSYCLCYLIGIFLYKNGDGFFSEIQGLIKVFYFPLLLTSLFEIKEEIQISKMTLFTVLFLYLILIFIPLLLGIGLDSYKVTKEGTLGYFNSANEISGIISILTPILFLVLIEVKKILPKILLGVMYLTVILMIGTKTPLIILCLTIGFSIAYLWTSYLREKKYKNIIYSIVIIILGTFGLLLIIPKTNFYKNIELHLDYLGLNSISEVFQKEELIDHFIFSQRLTFLRDKAKIYKEASTYQKFFGIGYLKDNKETKAIEMDYFDIYFNHGIIGCLCYFITTLYILFKILEEKQPLTLKRYMLDISLIYIILLSFLTGHIITTPSVSFLCVIIILSLVKHIKERVILVNDTLNLKTKIEKDYHVETIEIDREGILKILFYKILYYENYDFAYCGFLNKNSLFLTKSFSKNNAIYIENIEDIEKGKDYCKIIMRKEKQNKMIPYSEKVIFIDKNLTREKCKKIMMES